MGKGRHSPLQSTEKGFKKMNATGIDVSNGRSTVSVLRPFGEVVELSFNVKHTHSELFKLADELLAIDGETSVVMEHTGRYL